MFISILKVYAALISKALYCNMAVFSDLTGEPENSRMAVSEPEWLFQKISSGQANTKQLVKDAN